MLFRFVDLLLYGHFWIALAAWSMQAQTQYLHFGSYQWSDLDGFITAGTLLIYALHRLVAMRLQKTPVYAGRFKIMHTYQSHIMLYAGIAGLVGAYFFLNLSTNLQLTLLVPCAFALGYVLPIFKGRRLRDFPYLKIFLIAFSWAWLTVIGPVINDGAALNATVLLMFVERAAFVFAITIPFDIRDLALDREKEVATLPIRFGETKAKWAAYVALLLMMMVVFTNLYLSQYTWSSAVALSISALTSALFIHYADAKRHDYYYTGLLDGTMIFQGGLVYLLSSI